MTELTINQGADVVRVAPPVPLPSERGQREWEELAIQFVTYVFEGRPVCLVTDEARATDWPFAEDLATSTVSSEGGRFLLAFRSSGSPDLFGRVVRSSEFWWDAVWFAPVEATDQARISGLVRSVRRRGVDEAPAVMSGQEALLTFADGCGFWWLYPDKPADRIVAKLTGLARAVGWSCIAEPGKRATSDG